MWTRWFHPDWWQYLFAPRTFWNDDEWFLKVLWCRLRGHPPGIVFYNLGGWEPDNHCKGCGDDLG